MKTTLENVKPIASDLSETSHTPGPWRADNWAIGWTVSAPQSHYSVCHLSGCNNAKANAALIASAPELLEECERAHFEICQQILYGNQLTPQCLKAMAKGLRIAIAKAKGEIYTPVF